MCVFFPPNFFAWLWFFFLKKSLKSDCMKLSTRVLVSPPYWIDAHYSWVIKLTVLTASKQSALLSKCKKKEREKKWIMTPLLPLHSWQLNCWICGICFMCKLSSVWKIHFFHSLSQLFDPCFCELLSSQFLSELADIHKLLFLNLSVCANVWRRCSDQESSPA